MNEIVSIVFSGITSGLISLFVFRVSLEHRLTKLETTSEIIRQKVLGE